MTPKAEAVSPTQPALCSNETGTAGNHKRNENSIDKIPLLDPQAQGYTQNDGHLAFNKLDERK